MKIIFNWSQMNEMISKLISDIQNSQKKYDCVVGIKHGGIPISSLIAKTLNIPHKQVHISFYDNSCIEGDIGDCENLLIVDDLIDSGKTMAAFKDRFGNGDVAVIFWKKDAEHYQESPEFYVEEKPSHWVVFPWENNGQ